MLETEKLKELMKKYPKLLIYYHDNGSWCIFTSKADYDALEEIEDSKEFDKRLGEIELMSGDDHGMTRGYASPLVEMLAEILGMEVDSI